MNDSRSRGSRGDVRTASAMAAVCAAVARLRRAMVPWCLPACLVALFACMVDASAVGRWPTRGDLPPGWLGVRVPLATGAVEGTAVHIGGGWVLSVAHMFAGSMIGWKVDVVSSTLANPVLYPRRARLVALDTQADVAILRLDSAGGLGTAQACPDAPRAGEPVAFARVQYRWRVAVGSEWEFGRFLGVQAVPDYPREAAVSRTSGQPRYAFAASARPGMSGGGVFALDRRCFYGIVSMVDPTAAQGSAVTYVVPVDEFIGRLPRAADDTDGRG